MYAVAVIAFVAALAALFAQLAGTLHEDAAVTRQLVRVVNVTRLAEGLERYVAEQGTLPADLDALVAAPGFEYLRGYRDSWQGYALSGNLVDGTWTYQRAVTVSKNPVDGIDAATYLTMNRCGAGDAASAAAWCGASSGAWHRRESREDLTVQIANQRARQHRMLHKWAAYYSEKAGFPGADATGAPLAADSVTPLATLAGYAGTAATCTGTYTYQGIPVDCGEMFDQWGQPIGYHFISSRHIVIVAQAPFANEAGQRPVIATDFEVPKK